MNYITACPNCETQFLLNDELIKAYRGKVQCGHCEHVFNAKNRLTEVADDITSADEYRADVELSGVEEAVLNETLVSENLVEENEQGSINDDDIVINATQDAIAEFEQDESAQAKLVDIASETSKTQSLNKTTDVDYFISPPGNKMEPIEKSIPQAEVPDQTIDINDIFTNKSRDDKKPSKYSFLIGFINFLLFIVVLLLCTYFLRSEIARQFPPIKPLLERACVPLKCTIDLSKNLDLITIGDSDMQEDDTYQSVIKFSSSLKNNANYPQAYPSLELTLTDNNDRAVIKKLITPTLYLASKEKIKHGLDPSETATIKLSFRVDDPSVASYRILLLY